MANYYYALIGTKRLKYCTEVKYLVRPPRTFSLFFHQAKIPGLLAPSYQNTPPKPLTYSHGDGPFAPSYTTSLPLRRRLRPTTEPTSAQIPISSKKEDPLQNPTTRPENRSLAQNTTSVFWPASLSILSSLYPPSLSVHLDFSPCAEFSLVERDTDSVPGCALRFASITTTIYWRTNPALPSYLPASLTRCRFFPRMSRLSWPSCWRPCSRPTTMFAPKPRNIWPATGRLQGLRSS